ncbi:MAG: winged helix-turn-helix transcriptional regulator [Halobacteriota archaeon]
MMIMMQNLRPELDEKDKKILALILDNPKMSQKEIGDIVMLSQPSVATRLKRLHEMGFVAEITGMNLTKVGLHIAKIDVTASNPAKIINAFKNCPFFLNGFITSGKENVCLLFAGEDVMTLEAIVDLHLRGCEEVQAVNFCSILSAANDLVIPVKMNTGHSQGTPCGDGTICEKCLYYQESKCQGCPGTGV